MTRPGEQGDSGEQPESDFADLVNGLANGPGQSRRRRRRRRGEEPADEPAAGQPEEAQPAQADGAHAQQAQEVEPEQADEPAAEQSVSLFGPAPEPPLGGGDDEEAEPVAAGPAGGREDQGDEAAAVRPYAWTRGRTRPAHEFAVETLVSTSEHGHDVAALASVEHRTVAELCRSPRSVAEVAALLSLPLGVAKVLLADMTDIGLVVVHATASSSGDMPDRALMERVLSGLRRL